MNACLFLLTLSVAQADPPGPGDHTRTLMMGEQKRTYLVHVPKDYDPKKPAPVVLALHGAAMDGSKMVWFSGLNKTSDKEGYYLVHLMSGSKDFEQEDRQAATNFAQAAKRAGVRRIIYLGGLGDDADPKLSPHLRSRHEVGQILRDSGVDTIEFRASLVIGTGSLSFDLVKSLTDRLPVMLCPRCLTTPTQPIAVDDVVAYLVAAKDLPPGESRIVVGCGHRCREDTIPIT